MSQTELRNIAVCYPQVPFTDGGAELLVRALCDAFTARGYRATLVSVPFRWYPKELIADHCLAWRLLDIEESNGVPIDLVVATKFPSYVVRHPRKVTWLIHQFRQAYELFGTDLSDFGSEPEDLAIRRMFQSIDRRTLGESRRIFTISRTVADRLRHSTGLEGEPLYPPPRAAERFHPGRSGDYILAVGRLERIKRIELLVRSMRHLPSTLRAVIVGDGPDRESLVRLAAELGVERRIEFIPEATLDQLIELYSSCFGVFFAPFDEDFGFVTVEAFLAEKPVITSHDSGGVLELVTDGVTGMVVNPEPEAVAVAVARLAGDRGWARSLGRAGRNQVRGLRWDSVVDAMVEA